MLLKEIGRLLKDPTIDQGRRKFVADLGKNAAAASFMSRGINPENLKFNSTLERYPTLIRVDGTGQQIWLRDKLERPFLAETARAVIKHTEGPKPKKGQENNIVIDPFLLVQERKTAQGDPIVVIIGHGYQVTDKNKSQSQDLYRPFGENGAIDIADLPSKWSGTNDRKQPQKAVITSAAELVLEVEHDGRQKLFGYLSNGNPDNPEYLDTQELLWDEGGESPKFMPKAGKSTRIERQPNGNIIKYFYKF